MVSVIIISYNTKEITLKCLSFLLESQDQELEIIVVDNASKDESVSAIKSKFPKVKIIENKENVGFATANNQGMKLCKGEYILLLNSDCFVYTDTIVKSLDAMARNKWDVAGCRLVNADGTFQPSWGFHPSLRRVGQMMLFLDNLPMVKEVIDSIHIRSEKRHTKECEVDWVTGAYVLLKREIYVRTNGFDENYHMYGEEIEWLYRIKKLGYKIGYTPNARAVHLLGASSPDRSLAVIGEAKGWIYWFKKHNNKLDQILLPWFIKIGFVFRVYLKPSMSGSYQKAIKELS